MSYPLPNYASHPYPPTAPTYPPNYDPRAAQYGYPPPADPRPETPTDPYYGYPPQPQAAQPAPAQPQATPATQPPTQTAQVPPGSQDPYAQAHYDYYRQYYYPPPASTYPPPGTDQIHQGQQQTTAHPAPQAPQSHAPPYQAPQGHQAPAQTEYPAYPPAYPSYPGYDPSRPADPYAHYAAHYPPPGYPTYPHPPPGYPPVPYGYPAPPPHQHPPPAPTPHQSRPASRERRASPRRDRKRTTKAPDRPEKKQKVEPDARTKLLQHIQQKSWTAFWLEGIDPPQRAMSNSNVTMLILTKGVAATASSFGFLMAESRQPQRQKDRQRECMRDLLAQVEQLLAGKSDADLRAWCQIHDSQAHGPNGSSNGGASEADLEKLKGTVASRLAATGSKSMAVDLDFSAPSSFVIVSASPFEEESKRDESETVDFSAMNFFSADAAAQLEEARKLGGLLRLQWHLAVLKAHKSHKGDKGDKADRDKSEKGDEKDQSHRSIPLGIGFATEEALAKARALRAAEVRAEVLTEAMFMKTNQKEK